MIDEIIIHCSASSYGNAAIIDHWHRNRDIPFSMIGYHFVILNGRLKHGKYNGFNDGRIETGRDIDHKGAHVSGHNQNTIGICLIGESGQFTDSQINSLIELVRYIKNHYDIVKVSRHSDYDTKKSFCPGLEEGFIKHLQDDI
jgi:hypothetical protein